MLLLMTKKLILTKAITTIPECANNLTCNDAAGTCIKYRNINASLCNINGEFVCNTEINCVQDLQNQYTCECRTLHKTKHIIYCTKSNGCNGFIDVSSSLMRGGLAGIIIGCVVGVSLFICCCQCIRGIRTDADRAIARLAANNAPQNNNNNSNDNVITEIPPKYSDLVQLPPSYESYQQPA